MLLPYKTSSAGQPGAASKPFHADVRPWRALRPGLSPHDQVGQDHEQKGCEVEPADGILIDLCIALIAPRDRLTPNKVPLNRLCLSEIASAFERVRVDDPSRPGTETEYRIRRAVIGMEQTDHWNPQLWACRA